MYKPISLYIGICFFALMLFPACTSETDQASKSASQGASADHKTPALTDTGTAEAESDYATFFVVVADTNADYYVLHSKMLELAKRTHIVIDTMGRSYNPAKNLIALADNDEDEIYAGDYYPRRLPSESLSLEYLVLYQAEAGEKTIALVAGIYESEKDADRLLAVLKATEQKAYKTKASIYVGCLH